MTATAQLMTQSKSNEWGSPADVLGAARAVMGTIDLDPCSSFAANRVVQATEFYSQDQDGMQRPWRGRIWMNPPYGKKNHATGIYGASAWVKKLADEYRAGNVTEFCLLIRDSNAKYGVLPLCPLSCEPLYRIQFTNLQTGEVERSPQHNCNIYYCGPEPSIFAALFQQFGVIRHSYL